MLYFNCDYTEGAHPRVLEKMLETNLEQTVGYGEDPYCEAARELIRRECQRQDVDVQFLVGGTQTNFTVIRAALRPYQGVLSPATGHINGHETGAVEATGHKVLALPTGPEGKLTAAQVEEAVRAHWADEAREHLVQPKMVYISHPTENGALYTLAELEALSETCKELGLYLFLDGARLGYGLTARGSDVSLGDLARLCDVFYIGGTKCGALLGEAVVIANPDLQRDFRYSIKQNGGWRYKYGNMFYVQLVSQYLAVPHFSDATVQAIFNEALKYQGWNYVYGGSNPNTSFDCSGLVQWCYGKAGISLPRTAQAQYDAVQHIPLSQAKAGDLVFFHSTYSAGTYVTHVGIYAGNNRMYHAGDPIGYADLNSSYWQQHLICAGRVKSN